MIKSELKKYSVQEIIENHKIFLNKYLDKILEKIENSHERERLAKSLLAGQDLIIPVIITELKLRKPELCYFDENYEGE